MGSFLWKRSRPPQDTGSGSGEAEARSLGLTMSRSWAGPLFLFAVPPSPDTALSSLPGWSFALAKCCTGWVLRNEAAEGH